MSIKYRATLCGMVIGPRGNPLKLQTSPNGYKHFEMSGKSTSAHRFIYQYFKGPIKEGLVIDHVNGDRSDNRISNLEAVTQKVNVERGKNQKLTQEQVLEIRDMLGTKTQRTIAKQFGVSEQLICDIKKGRRHGSY